MELPQVEDYQSLFINETPMLDVRAPVEFHSGAFPHTKNLPLMNDEERHSVGIRYKEKGQEKAIELGHQLVSGDVKQGRVASWAEFVKQHPQGVLYCFRGGLRSRITQQWIYENTGVIFPRVKGGYKAMRRFLIRELDKSINAIQPLVLSGRTGVGKTRLLDKLQQKIDLEAIYQHRGSAFGKHVKSQPSQIDIENELSVALLKQRARNINKLVFEDEAANIGSRRLPENVLHSIRHAPLIILEAEIEKRINIVFDEYIVQALSEYQEILGDREGFDAWAANLELALTKIQRRLGGVRYQEISCIMNAAITAHRISNEIGRHKAWIRILLQDYYDPMYDYQLSKKTDRLIFRGDQTSVLEFLKQQGIS